VKCCERRQERKESAGIKEDAGTGGTQTPRPLEQEIPSPRSEKIITAYHAGIKASCLEEIATHFREAGKAANTKEAHRNCKEGTLRTSGQETRSLSKTSGI